MSACRAARRSASAAGRELEVLALPGHTLGHLGLWDAETGAAIVIDAVLADGVYDRAGNRLIPPRYYDAGAYEATIRRLRELDPELLLTAHYEVMERAAAREFLDRSLDFVRAVRGAVRASRTTDLRALTEEVDAAVGPFPAFTHELAASVRAHLAEPRVDSAAWPPPSRSRPWRSTSGSAPRWPPSARGSRGGARRWPRPPARSRSGASHRSCSTPRRGRTSCSAVATRGWRSRCWCSARSASARSSAPSSRACTSRSRSGSWPAFTAGGVLLAVFTVVLVGAQL